MCISIPWPAYSAHVLMSALQKLMSTNTHIYSKWRSGVSEMDSVSRTYWLLGVRARRYISPPTIPPRWTPGPEESHHHPWADSRRDRSAPTPEPLPLFSSSHCCGEQNTGIASDARAEIRWWPHLCCAQTEVNHCHGAAETPACQESRTQCLVWVRGCWRLQ